MYESWIIVEDVGREPDWRGQWEKLAIAHVTYHRPFGLVVLGNVSFTVHENAQSPDAITDQYSFESIVCPLQYFNDADDPREPDTLGTFAMLDVQSLYGEVCPSQLCCNGISKSEFETHLAFKTLPELPVSPIPPIKSEST